jgi:glycosyltransferase involved in cell wall biosynthesis
MRVLLLHTTFSPVPGGVERFIRQQAEELSLLGFQVTVVCGEGTASNSSYEVVNLPELSCQFPQLLQIRKVLENGQTDGNLTQFTRLLAEKLTPFFEQNDVVISHGALTTHFNFALTAALRHLADHKPIIAWAHDFTPTNPDYSLPFKDRMPWALMYQAHPKVTYVAPSELRRNELAEVYGLESHSIPIIPYSVDLPNLFGLTPEVVPWLRQNRIMEKDIVFYMPGKLSQRKNLEFACQILGTLQESGVQAALLLTDLHDPNGPANNPYLQYARFLPQQMGVAENVFFVNDHLPVTDSLWRELTRLSDVILYPSRYEAFGFVRFEAALTRMPCWTMELPAYGEIECPRHRVITSTAAAFREAQALLQTPDFFTRKTLLRNFNPAKIHEERVAPLLAALAATHT